MKKLFILDDAKKRPELFLWNGALNEEKIQEFCQVNKYCIPDDLYEFWIETGGGDFFESETIFSPIENKFIKGESIIEITKWYHHNGLEKKYLVFHIGGEGISVLDMITKLYCIVNKADYRVKKTFRLFNDWYMAIRNPDFAQAYSLEDFIENS